MRYLLLEDPIPAGVEFVQNEASYPIDQRPGGWYDWFTRREFHDDHAAFFASDFTGRQEIFYMVRVVNPGSFQISPARVQPMYQHGVQATSDALSCRSQHPQPPEVHNDNTSHFHLARRPAVVLGSPRPGPDRTRRSSFCSFTLWLRVPDASALDVAATLLLACLLLLSPASESPA